MKIIGLTRIRNEELIIQDTLDHLSNYCDFIIVYDDVSIDNTVNICKKHRKVKKIIQGKNWMEGERYWADTYDRQKLLLEAKKYASTDDWFVYIDADERIEFDWKILNKIKHTAIKMKLFDFYITEEDKELHYSKRKFLGPEYREILMAFKVNNADGYYKSNQRECTLFDNSKIIQQGYVKHYGKSISIEQWEETCDYYVKHFPKYAQKWRARKGKAIHTKSDFNRGLITWEEKERKGILLKGPETKKSTKEYLMKIILILLILYILNKIINYLYS